MSRDNALHPVYSKIHPDWQTPWVATFVIWFLGIVLLFFASMLPTVQMILDASIVAIGIQICFYMSLAGFACAWWYRAKLTQGVGNAFSYVLWPLLSALFMVFMALYLSYTNLSNEDGGDDLAIYLGFVGLFLGAVPLICAKFMRGYGDSSRAARQAPASNTKDAH